MPAGSNIPRLSGRQCKGTSCRPARKRLGSKQSIELKIGSNSSDQRDLAPLLGALGSLGAARFPMSDGEQLAPTRVPATSITNGEAGASDQIIRTVVQSYFRAGVDFEVV